MSIAKSILEFITLLRRKKYRTVGIEVKLNGK